MRRDSGKLVGVFDHNFDGFYTPVPTDVPSGGRWPWAVAAVGVAVIVAGGVAFSSSGPYDSGTLTESTLMVGSG